MPMKISKKINIPAQTLFLLKYKDKKPNQLKTIIQIKKFKKKAINLSSTSRSRQLIKYKVQNQIFQIK
jgi:hypothetical protein